MQKSTAGRFHDARKTALVPFDYGRKIQRYSLTVSGSRISSVNLA
jgi:hypothetical protein